MNRCERLRVFLICMVIISMHTGNIFAQDTDVWMRETKVAGLNGNWKFSIGDNAKWASPAFDDSRWEEISVPSSWEEQGFYGFDGYAWYRKHFTCSSAVQGRCIILELGYIDDVDEVYINGNLAGSTGTFPPRYSTAYSAYRKYLIPEKYLNINGDNVIAVRVYDFELSGGILSGKQRLCIENYALEPDYCIEGEWEFMPGDNMKWSEMNYDDRKWKSIIVPGTWESQGYADLDGFAWYRKKVIVPAEINPKNLVLLMGKIDDMDQVFVNGMLVGRTGKIDKPANSTDYLKMRGYFLPQDLLKPGRENVIAVRVYDGKYTGGIYSGPVGFVNQARYTKFFKNYKERNSKSFWDLIFRY